MGLGNFRYRLLILVVILSLIWFTMKVWTRSGVQDLDTKQISENVAPPKYEILPEKVLITVYYETLCPDSKSFVLKQLQPTFEAISDSVQIEFVPYGKAETVKTPDGYTFICQHQETECEANIIHACTIDSIKDSEMQLNLIACMIKNNMEPVRILETCSSQLNIDFNEILNCWRGNKGKELLAKYGEKTKAVRPAITFIPTVGLDNDVSNQPAILKNLLKEVCLKLKNVPKGCI